MSIGFMHQCKGAVLVWQPHLDLCIRKVIYIRCLDRSMTACQHILVIRLALGAVYGREDTIEDFVEWICWFGY